MCADRCLVWGMRSEPKNADGWDMGGKTGLTVPSVTIVHIGMRRMSESQAQARAQRKHGIRWRQGVAWGVENRKWGGEEGEAGGYIPETTRVYQPE